MKFCKSKSLIVCFVICLNFITTEQCRTGLQMFEPKTTEGTLQERFPGFDPDAYMDAQELIESKGIPYEGHTVTTEDGYILGLQRLARPNSTQQYPVLIIHGLLCSSESFLLNLRHQSLAYVLYDRGFDVWLGNVRGTKYSRNHTNLDPETKEFWDWSFDEMGKYDIPAMIDHVLEVTGRSKLNYIGHSQGAMVLFSSVIQHQWWYQSKSQIGAKIANFFALAPAVYIEHTWTQEAKSELLNIVESRFMYQGKLTHNEFAPSHIKDWIIRKCSYYYNVCARHSIYPVSGWSDNGNFNASRLGVYLLHDPSGTSTKNMKHWIQMMRRSNNNTGMKYYDYGSASSNYQHHNLLQAPEYNFQRFFGVNTFIYCGDKDLLVTLEDCQRLTEIVDANVAVVEGYAHLDFTYSTNANVRIYEGIIGQMELPDERDEGIDIDCLVGNLPFIQLYRKAYNVLNKSH